MTAPNGFTFNQLGIRVPTIAISPWIKKGTVVHDAFPGEKPTQYSEFDATSALSTSNILLGLQEAKPLTNRMGWSNTFAGVLNLESPRTDCPTTLPNLPLDPNPVLTYLKALERPVHEHMHDSLLFFCV